MMSFCGIIKQPNKSPTTTPAEISESKANKSHPNKNKKNGGFDLDRKGTSVAASPISSSKNDVEDVIRIYWTSTPVDDHVRRRNSVLGFENEMLSLKKLLGAQENDDQFKAVGLGAQENDDQFKAVGIVGTRGVGKTTLCQEYYFDEEEGRSRFFLPRVWVSMAIIHDKNEPREIAMLKRMLASLGVEEEKIIDVSFHDDADKLIKALLYMLRLQLIQKRYLIVLDDVRELLSNGWLENLHASVPLVSISTGVASGESTNLACALPKGCGGTVIVTSREEDIAKKMVGEANLHRVLPLPNPETLWLIFYDTINKRGDQRLTDTKALEVKLEKIREKCSAEFLLGGKKTNILLDLKEKVIMKCNGLPLTAKLMAETMPDLLDRWENQQAEQKNKESQEKESQVSAKEMEPAEVPKEGVAKETELIDQEQDATGKKEQVPD